MEMIEAFFITVLLTLLNCGLLKQPSAMVLILLRFSTFHFMMADMDRIGQQLGSTLLFSGSSNRFWKEDGIRVANTTDTSVVLYWNELDWDAIKKSNFANNTDNIRLIVQLESPGKPTFFMYPSFDDKQCSVTVSRCEIPILSQETRYKATVMVDNTKDTVFGFATVHFRTYATPDPGRMKKKILFYVVIPALCGFIIILVTLLLICAKCCSCWCWKKKASPKTYNSGRNNEPPHHQSYCPASLYDEANTSSEHTNLRQEDDHYLSVTTIDSNTHQLCNVMANQTTNTYPQPKFKPSLQMAELIVMQKQQQQEQSQMQQQQPRFSHNYCLPQQGHRAFSSPTAITQPLIENDGYLEATDPPGSSHYANLGLTQQRQMLSML